MGSGRMYAPPNLRGRGPRRLVYPSEPISTLLLSSSPSFRVKSHSSLNLHPSHGLVKESTSCCCHGMAEAGGCRGHERMHARPGKETDLDSSGARFEGADLNGGRVDEEATWFCSDAMAGGGQLWISIDCRNASTSQPRSHRLPHFWT